MAELTLREAENVVKIAGILKEKKLEIRNNPEKGRFISGFVVIKTGDRSSITVKCMTYEKTKDGQVSKIFTGLKTVMDEYVSIADCKQQNIDDSNATVVFVNNGKLNLNEYYGEDGNLKSSWSVSTAFLTSPKYPVDNLNMKSTFDIEGVLSAIKENQDTGAVTVDLIVPVYGGRVIPLSFTTQEDAGQHILNNFSKGETVHVWGNLVSEAVVKTEAKRSFGKPQETSSVVYKNELLIVGGDPEAYDSDSDKAFNIKAIKEAMANRETYLTQLKDKPKTQTKSTPVATQAQGKTTVKAEEDFDF